MFLGSFNDRYLTFLLLIFIGRHIRLNNSSAGVSILIMEWNQIVQCQREGRGVEGGPIPEKNTMTTKFFENDASVQPAAAVKPGNLITNLSFCFVVPDSLSSSFSREKTLFER